MAVRPRALRRPLSLVVAVALAVVGTGAAVGLTARPAGAALDVTMYGIATDQRIYGFNQTTGVATPISAALAFESAAIARQPGTGKLFVYEQTASANNYRVAAYDTVANSTTLLSSTFPSSLLRLAFRSDGELYGGINNVLYHLSPTTGAILSTTTLTGLPTSAGGDLTFGADNTMYLVANSTLWTFAPFTAAPPGTLAPTSTVALSRSNAHVGLAFGQSGALYAIDQPGTGNSTLSTINLGTGVETALPTSGTRFLDLTTTPNRAPTTTGTIGPLSTPRDTPVSATVTTGWSDPDGDPVTLQSAGGAVNGTVAANTSTGVVTFTPTHGYSGSASYTYTITDGNAGTGTRTVNVTVGPNQAPTAVTDALTVAQDTATPTVVTVLSNDTDPERDPLTVTAVGAPAHGTAAFTATTVTYTPAAGYSGPDTFTYRISDGYGGTATGTVNVTVSRGNRPPTYDAVLANTRQDIPAAGTLARLAATDPDGDSLTYSLSSGALPAGITLNGTGSFTGSATGFGQTSAVITVSDGKGGTASTTLVVNVANGAPTAVADSASTPMSTAVTIRPVDNDTDPNGDTLSLVSATAGSNGTVAVDTAAGTVVYTPNTNYSGSDSFSYVVSDGRGGSATGTVSVSVAFVNSPPRFTTNPDNSSQNLDPLTTPARLTATDANGDPLTYTITGGTLPGSVTLNPDGTFSGTTSAKGTYTVSTQVVDGRGGRDTGTLILDVRNLPPTATDDSDSTATGTPITTPVRFNDRDLNGDTLVVASVTQPSHGTVVLDTTSGNPTYTPSSAYVGSDSYTYTISDGNGGSATATVTITVGNAPPAYTSAGTNQRQAVLAGAQPVALEATDPNRDTLTFRLQSGSLPPGLTLNPDGSFSGIATTAGDYPADIVVTDGRGGSALTTLTLSVPNEAPVAVADNASTGSGASVVTAVRINDTDANGDPLDVVSVTDGRNGTVVRDATTHNPIYTPRAGFAGTDTYTYTVSDAHGGTSTGTVTVTVGNGAPTFTGDAWNGIQDVTARFTPHAVTATDPNGDPLTYSLVSGTLPGSVVLAADGSFSGIVTTAGDYLVRISVDDGKGGVATTDLTIRVANVAPIAVADAVSVPYGGSTDTDVRFNDTDDNGDTLVVTGFSPPTSGTTSAGPGGTVTYRAAAGFTGTATYTYTVSDGHSGTATGTVTVTVGNGAPVFRSDLTNTQQTVLPGRTPVALTADDPNSDPLTYTLVGGTLPDGVQLTSGGQFTGSPTTAGRYPVTVTVNDGRGGSDSTDLVLTVSDLSPTARDDNASTAYFTPVTVPVLDNDSDPNGDRLTVTVAGNGGAAHGTVVVNGGQDVTYSPASGFSGVDTFSYAIADGTNPPVTATVTVSVANAPPVFTSAGTNSAQTVQPGATPVALQAMDPNGDALVYGLASGTLPAGVGLTSNGSFTGTVRAAGTFIVTVSVTDRRGNPVPQTLTLTVPDLPPRAAADSDSTAYGLTATTDVLANDTDPNGDLLSVVGVTDGSHGTVALNGAGLPIYTPASGFSGVDAYTYTVSDGTNPVVGTVTVTVGNGAPSFTTAPRNTLQDVEPTATPLALDATDPNGDRLTFAVAGGSLPFGVSLTSTGAFTGSPSRAGDYSVDITVDDGNGGSDTTTLVLRVPNRAPTAADDSAGTPYVTPVATVVRFNDRDPNGDFLTVLRTTDGTHGTVALNGAGDPVYTPAPGFSGVDSYTYTVEDPGHLTSTAAVTVTVGNAPPVYTTAGANDFQDVTPGGRPTALVATDPNTGDVLTYALTGGALPGGLTLNADGSFAGAATGVGTVRAVVTVSDGNGGSDVTQLDLTVVNVGPTAVDDSASTGTDTAVTVDVRSNDTDPNGETLTLVSAGPAGHGTVSLSAGNAVYTPTSGYAGFDAFDYTVRDAAGATSIGTVTVAVGNAAPTFTGAATNRAQTVQPGAAPLALAATDANRDALTYRVLSGALPARMSLLPDGSFGGTASAAGTFTVTAQVSDGNGGTDTVTLALTVPNVAPVAVDDAAATGAGTPVTIAVRGNDRDPNGDPMTVTVGTGPGNGTVTLNGSGDPVYTPTGGFRGDDTFTYTVRDPASLVSNPATVTVSVGNAPPTFTGAGSNRSQAIDPGTRPVDVIATDPNGDRLTYRFAGGSLPGTVTLSSDGSFAGSATRADTFTATIEVSDGHLGIDTTTLVVVVNDLAPVAADDAASTTYSTPVTTAVLANDSDPNGDPLAVVGVGAAMNGRVTFTATGTTYTPDPGFSGSDRYQYTVSDPAGNRTTATVLVTVGNAAPAFTAASTNSRQDLQPGDVPAAVVALDPNPGDTVTYALAGGTLPAGVAFDGGTGRFSGQVRIAGTYTLTLTATDDRVPSATSAPQTLVLTVAEVGPTAVDDTATTPYRTPVDIDVVANDTDPNGDARSVSAVGPAAHGTAAINGAVVTYTPDLGFSGTDSFDYTVSSRGGTDVGRVTVTVDNAPPLFTAAPTNRAQDVQPGASPVSLAASDPNGDPLLYRVVTGTLPGGIALANDGSFSGAAQAAGDTAVTVEVSDSRGGTDTVGLTLHVPNAAPVAVADSDATPTDTPVTTQVTANDSDANADPLAVTAVTAPAHGSVTWTGGRVTYTPAATYTGPDSYTYTVSDTGRPALSDSATVTITVGDAPPVFTADAENTAQDLPPGSTVRPLTATDANSDPLTYAVTRGSLPLGVTLNSDGTFTGAVRTRGTSTVTVTVSDGRGGQATTILALTVDNAAPVANPDLTTTPYATAVTTDVLANDTDANGDPLSVVGLGTPGHGTVGLTAGRVTYTPFTGFSGSDTYTYTASDGRTTAQGTVQVIVGNGPPAFTSAATNTAQTVAPGTTPVAVLATDPENDPLTYALDSGALPPGVRLLADGTFAGAATGKGPYVARLSVTDGGATDRITLTVTVPNAPPAFTSASSNTGQTVSPGSTPAALLATDPNGDALTYAVTAGTLPAGLTLRPDGTFTGVVVTAGSFPVTVTVTDPDGATATTRLTLTVDNLPPAFTSAPTNTSQTVVRGAGPASLAATDPNGDALTYAVTTGTAPAGITLNPDGTWNGSPTAPGVSTLDVTVSDGALTDVTRLTLTVPADPPVLPAGPDIDETVAAGATPPNLTATVFGGGPTTFAVTGGSLPPGISMNPDGTFTGVAGPVGTWRSTFSATANSLTTPGTLTIHVLNAPPAYTSAPTNTAQTVVAGDRLASLAATDPNGDALTYATASPLPAGVALNPDGTFTGTAGAVGSWTVTATVTDTHGATATTVLVFTVPNSPPVLAATARAVLVGATPTALIASDPNGDPLTFAVTAGSLPAGVTLLPDGTFSGGPTTPGTYAFSVTVTDSHGASVTAPVTIAVTALAPPPPAPVPPAPAPPAAPAPVPSPPTSPSPVGPSSSPTASATPQVGVDAGSPSPTSTPSTRPSASSSRTPSAQPSPAGGPGTPSTHPSVVTNPTLDQTRSTGLDQPVTVDLTGRGTHPTGLHVVDGPAHGTVTLRPDGTALYAPDRGYSGVDAFTYAFTGGSGTPYTGTVHIQVGGALPRTGADTGRAVGAGLALLLGGWFLLLAGRRRNRDEEPKQV